MASAKDIREVVQPMADEMGITIYDIHLKKRDREPVAEILVDAPGGLNVDGCGRLHRRIAKAIEGTKLDEVLISVSTPGATRRCRFPQDFLFYPERNFEIRLKDGGDLGGLVKILNQESGQMQVGETEVNWSDVAEAKFRLEF